MLKSLLKLSLLTLNIFFLQPAIAQSVTYGTKVIGKWRLEKFPLAYYKPAFKLITQKAPIIGKVALYQEINQYGQNDGLRVEMQTDYVSPHTIYYYKKGVVVYAAYYFPNSTKPYEIVNKNLNDQYEGPHIKRTINNNNSINEIVEVYKNGDLVQTNKPENRDVVNFENDLLQGRFKYAYDNSTFEGIAEKGEVTYLKKTNFDDVYEYKIIGNEIKVSVLSGSSTGTKQTFTIKSHLKITNNKNLSLNDERYIYWDNGLELFNVLRSMTYYTAAPYAPVLNYENGLLTGLFKIRKSSEDGFADYEGVAANGIFKSLKKTEKSFNRATGETTVGKTTEYKFEGDSISVYEYTNNQNEKALKDSYKAYRNLVITNTEPSADKPGYKNIDAIDIDHEVYYLRYVRQ